MSDCDPMDYIVHGILQVRILEWIAFPFSRGSFQPRDRTQVSHIAGKFFTSWATREAHPSRGKWQVERVKYLCFLCSIKCVLYLKQNLAGHLASSHVKKHDLVLNSSQRSKLIVPNRSCYPELSPGTKGGGKSLMRVTVLHALKELSTERYTKNWFKNFYCIPGLPSDCLAALSLTCFPAFVLPDGGRPSKYFES